MTQAAAARIKIPTETPQLLHSAAARRAGRPKKGSRKARSRVIASGTGRATTRGSGEVIERLAKVHWQAGDRPLPPPRVSVAGESALWVDHAEIPASEEIAKLGRALVGGRHGERDELMTNIADAVLGVLSRMDTSGGRCAGS